MNIVIIIILCIIMIVIIWLCPFPTAWTHLFIFLLSEW